MTRATWAKRRDPSLLVAVAVSAALAATLLWIPSAPYRIPLALLALWTPGYALLAVAYPRGPLARLERHALAACAGLCLLPLLVLLASATVGLTAARIALLGCALTVALAAVAQVRARAAADAGGATGPEPLARTRLPSTRATVALCVAALVVAAVVEAGSALTARPAPPALAMSSAEGPLDLRLAQGEQATLVVEARAGARPEAGELRVTWDGTTLAAEEVSLAAGASRAIEVALPTDARGEHALVATWLDLQTHAILRVEAP